MLKLAKINKSYKTGDFIQNALEDLSLEFGKNEFVSILGPSGSGKTTLLNIIGGLDRYDSGDIIINGKSTTNFKDKDWDYYRNNCIGFIFQSYNLISHISILENVEMALTLSGITSKTRKKRAKEALEKVGLIDHIHKKPNQLSGGQMQRVAIARAIVNNPDIILADEPTGALDSKTSYQIMELIKEISKEKLVIMVTHNSTLAKEYSTRIIELKDGHLIKDSKPLKEETVKDKFKIKKTSMNFFTALKLSFNNIITKKGRTLLTSFASSIGIIGIALILSLSNGFDKQIDIFEKETLSNMPVIISKQVMDLSDETVTKLTNDKSLEDYPDIDHIYLEESKEEQITHKNNITKEYIKYIDDIPSDLVSGLLYYKMIDLKIINNSNNNYNLINTSKYMVLPKSTSETSYIDENYDLIYGTKPSNKNELLLLVDSKNRIDKETLESIGYSDKEIKYDSIIGKELKLVLNNDYYSESSNYFTPRSDYQELYNSSTSVSLKISGIIRGKSSNKLSTETSGILYTNDLLEYIISENNNSNIVNKQKEVDYNILTMEKFDLNTNTGSDGKENMLTYLGADTTASMIYIYPKDFNTKEKVIDYLDKYNKDLSLEDKIVYTDLAKTISSLSSNIMNAITIVLVAFSAISLVVSSIMIGIITYISVLERTKEIGILRSLGARKKDISRVFNAETFLIGIFSGILGIGITLLLLIPTNIILENLTELKNVASLNPYHALVLIIISVSLTLLGGWIPAKIASKKDPVIALRTD